MTEQNASPARDGLPAPVAHGFDRLLHGALAQLTGGLAPIGANLAVADWLSHLALSPDTQVALAASAARNWQALYAATLSPADAPPAIAPEPHDKRFADPAWKQWPFNVYAQAQLLGERWWREATTNIPGVSGHHEQLVSFGAKSVLEALAPSNAPLTNPVVLERTRRENGANLVRGARNAAEDAQRALDGEPAVGTEAFVVGRDVAVTPGRVVFRNRLIELIQYTPTTQTVHAQPVLIMSAWIMKYYILDLSPENSLIRYLVAHGHTVFAISWLNPTAADRDLDLEDYRRLGFLAALDAVGAIVPDTPVHAVGYCLGGTLLAIAAAALARDGDTRLGSITLFAAETDFTEPGDLGLFIDEDQLAVLDAMMAQHGVLTSQQMAGAFQLLRANELLWSVIVHEYLLGERQPLSDLMAWNADGTRMPARMHAQYLHRLFLHNDLAEGRLIAGGAPVSLRDIRVPLFVVSTAADHVAPWRSVFKIHALTSADVTFVLTSGGHNVGIVNPPGVPKRTYQRAEHAADAPAIDAARWAATAPVHDGSWWPAWLDWLAARSGAMVAPPPMGNPGAGYAPLCDAPGTYIHAR